MGKFRFYFSLISFIFLIFFAGVHPSHADGTLYMSTGFIGAQGSLYMVNTDNANTTYIGPADGDGLALSLVPGTFLYNSLSLTDDPDTGRLSRVETDGSGAIQLSTIQGDADRGLAFNATTGLLYGTDNNSFGIIDPATGNLTPMADLPVDREVEAIAADPINNVIYGLTTDGPAYLMVYDVATNSWSEVGRTGNIDGSKGGLAYDPTANILYAADDSGNLFRINPATAADTYIGDTGIDEDVGLTFVPETEPIPSISQWGLISLSLILATAAYWFLSRRKREIA